jgi:SAM-dependent methyltransferase
MWELWPRPPPSTTRPSLRKAFLFGSRASYVALRLHRPCRKRPARSRVALADCGILAAPLLISATQRAKKKILASKEVDVQTTASVTPDRIMQISHGLWPAAIVSSAAAYDFFTHIAHGHATADAVAAAAGTDRRGTRMVLDSLVALELLTKQGGRYALAPDADAFLVRDRQTSIADMVAEHPRLMWDDWGQLREALKTGRPVKSVDDEKSGGEFFPKLVRMIMSLSLGPADAVAEHLGVGSTLKSATVLDIGAGSCAWTIPFARRDRTAAITAFDLAPVLEEAQKIVREFAVADSFRMQAGDYRKDEFGTNYDIAVLGNICHIESPDANRQLFARIRRALKPGGRLIIGDMLPNEERTGPPFPVMFAINMFLHSNGDTYTFSEYESWLRGAGFGRVDAYDTRRTHSPVIIATN